MNASAGQQAVETAQPTSEEKGKQREVGVQSSVASSSVGISRSVLSKLLFRKVGGASTLPMPEQPVASTSKIESIDLSTISDNNGSVENTKQPTQYTAAQLDKGKGRAQDSEAEIDELEEEEEPSIAHEIQSLSGSADSKKMSEKEIMELWNREVAPPSTKLLSCWEPIAGAPALTHILLKRVELVKLQKEAGRDAKLQLESRRILGSKLEQYARQENEKRSTTSYLFSQFEGFCRTLDISPFPFSEALFVLFMVVTHRHSNASSISKRKKLALHRSLCNELNKLWAGNEAFSQLYHFEGVKEAVQEWRNLRAGEPTAVKKQKAAPSTVKRSPPKTDVATSTFTPSQPTKTSRLQSLLEEPVVKRPRLVPPIKLGQALPATSPPIASSSTGPIMTILTSNTSASAPPPSRLPRADLEAAPVSRTLPPPSAACDDRKTPPPTQRHEPPASLPSPALSASAAERQSSPLLLPPPLPSRIFIEAENIRKHQDLGTVPLPLSSLRSFLRALDPALVFLAEPLHVQGLNTEEMLVNFVSFEMRTRLRLVVAAVKKQVDTSGEALEVTPEQLETLEKALGSE